MWAELFFVHTSSIPIPEQHLLMHKNNSSLGRHQRLLCISTERQATAAEVLRDQHRQDSISNTSSIHKVISAAWKRWASTWALCISCCAWKRLWNILQIQKGSEGTKCRAAKLSGAPKSSEGLSVSLLLLCWLPLFHPSKDVPRDFFWEGLQCFWDGKWRHLHFFPLHKLLSEDHTAEILRVRKMMPRQHEQE